MQKEHLPIYQIQDFEAQARKEQYFYFSTFSAHLQEHLFTREPHKHDFYIILLVTQGSGIHTIDFREYDLQPGMVFFLSPGQVHSWRLSDDADGFVVFFTQEFYTREYPDKSLFNFPFFHAISDSPVLRLSDGEDVSLLPVLHLLRQEFGQTKPLRHVMLSRLLDVLLIELTRLYRPAEGASETVGKDRALLQNLYRLLDAHYKEHKPVAFYADNLHVTPKHLNEICKGALGRTTKELLQHRVLLEAQRLLVHADLTSSQIAAELGYFDNTYFFRFFKKQVGCTPEQFRAANR
ncbi:helix-turn-helix domain-containing protein [Pontibacter roseus]|uniref:helix-turn-helix domain-containing protein n=1 Tax=Pontibacter roseus TaxID=336989 RepID=UPI0003612594|nr:AraC family transcriptional regulator [Pontibacter roseus]